MGEEARATNAEEALEPFKESSTGMGKHSSDSSSPLSTAVSTGGPLTPGPNTSEERPVLTVATLAIIAAVAIAMILFQAYRASRYSKVTEEEAEIVTLLKRIGGWAYQSDIVRLTGLPKATAWRYIEN